jgi:serine-type D-Ala-D-Ala carboxypeptidase (penicillin-binding protein 5/6)
MQPSRIRTGILAVLIVGVAALTGLSAIAAETTAREAILIDTTTGAVLLDKNADQSMPPASMSKIMTIYLVFERLKDGRLSMDDEFLVSEKAWRMGGSKMFVKVGNRIRIEDLLRGVIVQSGNDACIVLAEGISGTEEAFAEEMTRKAAELGMTGSEFFNSTGWPGEGQRMTARDLATLAQRIIQDFPEYYYFFAETVFTWNDIRQPNRNPMIYASVGADGLKTGFTDEAGYGLTASAIQGDRRLILVLNGLESVKTRAAEGERLLSWGFREFDNYALVKPGEVVDETPVWLGETPTVGVVVPEGVTLTLPRKARADMQVKVVYESQVTAPIVEGQEVGKLVVSAPETAPIVVPLLAANSVDRLGPIGRITAGLRFLIFGAQ